MKNVLVLMSTYNGENYLVEQIESILSQKDINVHLLVRDDGSKDNTLSILKKYEKNKRIDLIKGVNLGCANSFKFLLLEAYKLRFDYDYFAFADQDDVWFLDKLHAAALKLSTYSEDKPIMYCSNLLVVDKNLNERGLFHPKIVQLSVANSLIESIATGCTMVFNRKVVELFHDYTPKTLRIHDLWIYHMCILLGEVCYDSQSYVYYRQHGNNVIGARISTLSRLKSKWISLRHFWKQHRRELEAKSILDTYGVLLSDDKRYVVGLLANYRKKLYGRIRFFFLLSRYDFKMRRVEDNFWFKVRVLLGCV